MNDTTTRDRCPLMLGALAAALGIAATSASAQAIGAGAASPASDPNPYYIGARQAFTHDSNVFRIPSGPGDTYSSTSLLGGFDQPIGRQRVFGNATVSANRYQDKTRLDNTSYSLAAGLDWSTLEKLSGNVNVALGQNLAAPAASSVLPTAIRNLARTQNVGARARWGGDSLLSVEGTLGYSKLDYSAPAYVSSESTQDTASLGLYYRPGALLRLGVAGRVNRTETPKALQLTNGGFQSNTIKGNNLDFLADYELGGLLTANGRLSYTRQTNSGISSADFSGLTGSLSVAYSPTGKLLFNLYATHDAGFNARLFNGTTVILFGTTPILAPVTGLYENNRVTNSAGLGVNYAATAKINANARLRYARAQLDTTVVTGTNSQASPEITDVTKSASLGANYAIARNWMLACNLSHEVRDVSGGVTYSYSANTVGCSAQFTWR